MSLSDILVCIDPSSAGEQRLSVALRLARDNKATLTAAYPLYDEAVEAVLFPADRLAMAGAGDRIGQVSDPDFGAPISSPPGSVRAEIAAQRFRETLRQHGLEGDWQLLDGANMAELVELAKTVDLTVCGQFERGSRARSHFRPEDIALGCGQPVLIVPYAGSFGTIGNRVLVAWDATREAARAMRDALPLMQQAELVTVMTVVGSESEREAALASLDRVVRHLAHHGIPAQAEASLRAGLGVSDVLLSRASDLSADLIVAGLYHHSPYREALFGGVTHDLLDHMTLPVLMTH